jgi:prolyl oligopeptidase
MKQKSQFLLIPLLMLWLVGCSSNPNADVPRTEKDTVTTNYFGTVVSDPYRWLENGNSQKVKEWIKKQNKFTDKILSGFSEGKKIASRINTLSITSVEQFSPELINGKLFFMQFTPPQAQPVVAYKDWPNGKVMVLINPNKEKHMAVTGFWPSPKGNYIAYGTAVGGNEATTIHIKNVKTGKDLKDVLPYAGGGATPTGLVWDANEKGLTYVRLPSPGQVPESESQFYAALYHHKLGQTAEKDKLVFGKNLSKVAEYTFVASKGAKHAAMFVHFGDGNPDYVYLRRGTETWKQVLNTDANVRVASEVNAGAAWDGDRLLVISYQDAPKGKLLSISSGGRSSVLVKEGNWAMNSVSTVKNGFLITKLLGPDWKVDQYNSRGKLIRTVGLPKTGIGVGTIASSSESENALITYSGWTIPERWVQYNSANGNLKTIFQVKPAADYSKIKVTETYAVSKDGTKIPVTILAMDGITPNGKRPTIVYGYGGFGIPTAPHFIGTSLVWLENGGVLAYANIRGGGEFGEGWHEEGMLGKKQNVFDDMYAAAESMVKNKWTDSQHLGILGGSNGGLLMGAELTQHPDAFKAVVSFVGIYDMLRAELFPNGQYNISEYGTSTKEPDFKWLYAYSPYYNIKPNTSYPATLLETGVNDPRVAPWQSRKFAAALQAANNSNNPILLLTRMNEGHGVTASFSQRLGNTGAAFTFFAHELGLEIK